MDNIINLLSSFLPKGGRKPLVSPLPKSGNIAGNLGVSDNLEAKLQQGFNKFGKGTPPPIATQSAQLAALARQLPKNLQYFPAALTLRETGGLGNSASARRLNNPVGIGPGIAYPSLETSILGGGTGGPGGKPQKGLRGILLDDPRYKKFLENGDLAEFVRVYSPHKNRKGEVINPPEDQQVKDLMYLISLFQ